MTHTSTDSSAKETISVFKNPKGEALYLTNYNALLTNWPVKYNILELGTSFAKTPAIVSGPEDAYPLVRLHGYNFSSLEWLNSIASLSRNYRTYAIDIAGQVGKSVLYQPIKTAANYR